MSTDEYVPSDQDMRWQYVVKRMHDGATRTHAEREYTRWLAAHDARVRRDAWDEGGAHVEGRGGHYDPDDNPYGPEEAP